MPVIFNNMPADQRTSLFFAEFNAGAPPFSGTSVQVLIGHKLSTGAAPVGLLIPLGSQDPNGYFGPGSMLAAQAAYARRADPSGEIYALPIAEPGGATPAIGSIAISGTATAAGTLVRFIAGERVSVPVGAGDTAATVAARLAAAITDGYVLFNRRMGFPVVPSVSSGTLTLTARHGGTIGNGNLRIDEKLDGDETDPPGLTFITTQPTGGAGDVDLAAALALIGPSAADWITSPWASTSQLNAVRSFLSDAGTGRWAPTVQKLGHYTTAMNGTLSALTSFGAARNDQHVSILGTLNFPHPAWSIAASLNGVIARSKNLAASLTEAIEIARPLHTLELEGIRPPKAATDQWGDADRNTLYRNGIAGYRVSSDRRVRLERIVTTYQRNVWEQPDITFLDVETMAISAYVGRYFRHRIETTYPRHVLKDENPRAIPAVVTPESAKGTLIHTYVELCDIGGICENAALFAKYVVCERSADPNRLNAFLPVDVANQLRVFAANITIFTQMDENRLVS